MVVLLVLVIGYFSFNQKTIKYVNQKYHFSFNYPIGWEIQDNDSGPEGVNIKSISSDEYIIISYFNSFPETSTQAPLDKRNSLREMVGYDMTDIEEIQFSNGVAYKGIFTNEAIKLVDTEVWAEHHGHVYQILFSKYNGDSFINNTKKELTEDDLKLIESFKWED